MLKPVPISHALFDLLPNRIQETLLRASYRYSGARDVLDYVLKEAFLSQRDCSLDLRLKSKRPHIFVPLAIFTQYSLLNVRGLVLMPSSKWPGSYERVRVLRAAVDMWGISSTMRRLSHEVNSNLLLALVPMARRRKIISV
jgi:hypothetical protein